MKKLVIICLIIVVIVILIGVWFILRVDKVKNIDICGPENAGKSHSLDYCDKSCNTDADCKFVCGCGAININEECDTGNMEIKCLANFPVKCENKECVVGEK